jgi:hypothetical protein
MGFQMLINALDSMVGIETRLQVNQPSGSGSFTCRNTLSRSSPTRPDWNWRPMGAVTPGVKRPGRETYHQSSPSAQFKNEWSFGFTPPYPFLACTWINFA